MDGRARALVPRCRISDCQDYRRLGERLHELFVERAGRPVDCHLVAREELLPVHPLPGGGTTGGLPEPHVPRIPEELAQGVARAEAQLLQGRLQRRRPRAAEASPYYPHVATLHGRHRDRFPYGSPKLSCRGYSTGSILVA